MGGGRTGRRWARAGEPRPPWCRAGRRRLPAGAVLWGARRRRRWRHCVPWRSTELVLAAWRRGGTGLGGQPAQGTQAERQMPGARPVPFWLCGQTHQDLQKLYEAVQGVLQAPRAKVHLAGTTLPQVQDWLFSSPWQSMSSVDLAQPFSVFHRPLSQTYLHRGEHLS